jgi:heptose-I-phosphate ethanolaminephosphotransferase
MAISPSFAILFAYFIVLVLHFIRRSKHPLLSKIFLILAYTSFSVLILFESVTIFIFEKPICAEMLDAILATNTAETGEFINTYLSQLPLPLAVFFIALIFALFLRKRIQKYRVSCPIAFIFLIAMAPALESIATNVVHYAKSGRANGSYRSTSITRLVGAVALIKKASNEMNSFKIRSHPDTIQYISREIQCSNIVVIIGESFSKYHSSLYSYPKATNPKLGELAQSNLYVYNDVITLFSYTTSVIKTIYGITRYRSDKMPPPPFPSVLRGAGYKTELLDQRDYLTEAEYQIIWDNMYDTRNKTKIHDDMDLINTMDVSKAEPNLYVINLRGQHYTYANRYPESFAHFQRSDYPNVSNNHHAEIIAHYDNATLYNDFVIYNAIQKFVDKEAVILYFSDHGEEIYDYRNFMGHGGLSEKSKKIKYQIEIPFMIWVSDLYKENHPDTVEKIKNAVDRPYNTGDLVHLIMDISGIKAKGYDPTRSVINDQFDSTHDRIVHGFINYDQRRREGRH